MTPYPHRRPYSYFFQWSGKTSTGTLRKPSGQKIEPEGATTPFLGGRDVMRRGIRWVVSLCLLSLSSAAIAGSDAWLITPEEAAMASAPEESLIQRRGLSEAGPVIEIVKPVEGGSAPSPLEILIRFVARPSPVEGCCMGSRVLDGVRS
jgi:hypothetical protein